MTDYYRQDRDEERAFRTKVKDRGLCDWSTSELEAEIGRRTATAEKLKQLAIESARAHLLDAISKAAEVGISQQEICDLVEEGET